MKNERIKEIINYLKHTIDYKWIVGNREKCIGHEMDRQRAQIKIDGIGMACECQNCGKWEIIGLAADKKTSIINFHASLFEISKATASRDYKTAYCIAEKKLRLELNDRQKEATKI
tara:strand:+ start:132 stop:479 length:348 start_codon:yes stop_codon:yes gene_type:complete